MAATAAVVALADMSTQLTSQQQVRGGTSLRMHVECTLHGGGGAAVPHCVGGGLTSADT